MLEEYNEESIPYIDITDENIDNINMEDIVAIRYAGGCSMGDSGGIQLLSYKNGLKFYYINLLDSEKDIIDKVMNGFFQPFGKYLLEHNFIIYDKFDGWKSYYTGCGNNLYVRNEYVDKFEKVGNSYRRGIVAGQIGIGNVNKFLYETFNN